MTCFAHITEAQGIILAALIAAMVGALSWLGKSAVSAILWFYGRLGREAEMLVALKAEIGTAVDSLGAYTVPNAGDPIKTGILTSPNYRIFIPLDRDYFIFERVKPNISLLPEAPIRQIVEFYDDMGGFDTLVGLIQEPRFENFSARRRVIYIDDMIKAAAIVEASGRKALRAIDNELWTLAAKRNASLVALLSVVAAAAIFVWRAIHAVGAACGFTP